MSSSEARCLPYNDGFPEAKPVHPVWSMDGHNFDAQNPEQQPDPARLEAIRHSIRNFAATARPRFWARETLAYAIELSNLGLLTDPQTRQTLERILNERFAKATKAVIGGDPAEQISVRTKEELDAQPSYQAFLSIIETDPELQTDIGTRNQVDDFARAMLSVRY